MSGSPHGGSRRQPTRAEVRQWAVRRAALAEWRRYQPDEPRWERIRRAGDLIGRSLAESLPDAQLPCAETVREAWVRSAGQFNAEHARPSGWQRGALVIEVDHPALRFELLQHRTKLLERMQAELAPTTVRSLQFRLVG